MDGLDRRPKHHALRLLGARGRTGILGIAGRTAVLVAPVRRMGSLGLEMASMTPCDACNERRLHTAAEWSEFHEYAGHGYAAGVGWPAQLGSTHRKVLHRGDQFGPEFRDGRP